MKYRRRSQSRAFRRSAGRPSGSRSCCAPSSRAGRASSPRQASRGTDMNKRVRLWNDYDRPHSDLREAIDRMERAGELLRIRGADWKLEMGTLAEIVYRQDNPPAILFEDIPGYPGCRAASGLTNSARRMAITLGFPELERRSEEHTSELQSLAYLVCRLLLEKKKKNNEYIIAGHADRSCEH